MVAINGTHVSITIAEAKQASFRNRKQSLSQNPMLVCGFDRRFTYVMAGWEGSASDAAAPKSTLDDEFQVPWGNYFLVVCRLCKYPKIYCIISKN